MGEPVRSFIGSDSFYDDPHAFEGGVDAPRVFIWDLHPDTRADCTLTTASGKVLRVPYGI